jgi:hypothetical protein
MSPAGARFALLPLLLLPLVGCAELQRVDVSDLRPGTYCEIEMVVPPNAAEDSHHKYMGWVKDVNHDEVVLTGDGIDQKVMEQTNIDYNGKAHAMTQRKHNLVHVPLTGVVEIWAERSKTKTGASSGSPAGSAAPPAIATAKLPPDGPKSVMMPGEGAARF